MSRETVDIVENHVLDRVRKTPKRPLVFGICGAQGSGKTTLVTALANQLEQVGLRTFSLSLDDIYLPRAERAELAREIHPLLGVRGVPGTHDVAIGTAILDRLGGHEPVDVPAFDKAADDRALRTNWTRAVGPFDVILFEGWCIGAIAQHPDELRIPINRLESSDDPAAIWRTYVNASLGQGYQALFARIDSLVLLQAPGFEIVVQWRNEQEETLRQSLLKSGRPIDRLMDTAAITRFVSHFERLTRHILSEMPSRADLVVPLDPHRRPLIV